MLAKCFSIIRNYVLSVSSRRKYNFYHQNTLLDAFRTNSRNIIGRNPSMVIPLLATQDLTPMLTMPKEIKVPSFHTLDRRLNFKNHVSNLCKKASQKLHALAKVSKYMEKSKLELTMTSFLMAHFSYCPLVWVFHDRKSYNKINKIHERALRIIHKDSTSNFESLLIKSNSVSIHQRSLQLLLIEIYKTVNNPYIRTSIFHGRSICNQCCAV